MKSAKELRQIAREALSGHWKGAIFTGFIAGILGASTTGGIASPSFNFNFNFGGSSGSTSQAQVNLSGISSPQIDSEVLLPIIAVIVGVLIVVLAIAIAWACLGSIISLGYCKYNINLVDRSEKLRMENLFDYFKHWRRAIWMAFKRGLYVFLWSLALVIPGIIAGYSYAMAGYILAEEPELSADTAIGRSKAIMEGHRWELFCLNFSFIGWSLLCLLTLGIGYFWLTPYMEAAKAAFFRELYPAKAPETEAETAEPAAIEAPAAE